MQRKSFVYEHEYEPNRSTQFTHAHLRYGQTNIQRPQTITKRTKKKQTQNTQELITQCLWSEEKLILFYGVEMSIYILQWTYALLKSRRRLELFRLRAIYRGKETH